MTALLPALDVGLRPSQSARVLLVGQTGVGKTTEIGALLDSSFSEAFAVFAPPIDRDLDLELADWSDFLVYAAGAAAQRWQGRAVQQACESLAAALRPREMKIVGPMPTIVATGGPPEPSITQRFRNNTREVHDQIAAGRAQCWDLATGVLRAIETAEGGKPLVIVLDGLEKVSVERAHDLFARASADLARWPCRLLVTGPLGMTAEPWFSEVEENLTSVEHLRAVSCLESEPGTEFFVGLATRRGAFQVMDRADVDGQVSWSGGLPRQFLQLLTRAAQDAAAAGLHRVPAELHQRARHRLAQRWQYQLEPQDMKALGQPDGERTREARNRLLRVGALIEYDRADGSLGRGTNPLVGLLLKRETDVDSAAS